MAVLMPKQACTIHEWHAAGRLQACALPAVLCCCDLESASAGMHMASAGRLQSTPLGTNVKDVMHCRLTKCVACRVAQPLQAPCAWDFAAFHALIFMNHAHNLHAQVPMPTSRYSRPSSLQT